MSNVRLLTTHNVCPETGFCRQCGAFLDTILSEHLICFDGVAAISHLRARARRTPPPAGFPVLRDGERARPGTFYAEIVLECLAEYAAKRAANRNERRPEPAHTT